MRLTVPLASFQALICASGILYGSCLSLVWSNTLTGCPTTRIWAMLNWAGGGGPAPPPPPQDIGPNNVRMAAARKIRKTTASDVITVPHHPIVLLDRLQSLIQFWPMRSSLLKLTNRFLE